MFVDVILPLALPKLLTYSVPQELQPVVREGMRVAVQMGRRKVYAAIVLRMHNNAPEYSTKHILSVLDSEPLVNEQQLALWAWVSQYYMCGMGEVMKAALPAALKMESETRVSLNAGWEDFEFDDAESNVVRALESKDSLSIEELSELLQSKNAFPMVQRLLQKQVVQVDEQLQNRYKPRYETLITLHADIKSEDDLNAALAQTARAPMQEKLLLAYVSMAMPINFSAPFQVPKKFLLEKTESTDAVLKACINKKIFELVKHEVSRLDESGIDAPMQMPVLSPAQQKAFDEIKNHFAEKQVALLHGVTSSGKTEIYMRLIDEALAQGKQVLYLLPEIALTAQLINRLKKVFSSVGVYHSKFSDAQRVEVYQKLLKNANEPTLILGVRSSLFLPFSNLGLVIVDEEHENTYKQQDPAPRYHARDTAIVMAARHGAKVLLGSATPSIESYSNAVSGKYGLVELFERYGQVELPEVQIVNVSFQRKQQNGGHFSPLLLKEVGEALEKKEQVILFQNRRGFSPYVECKECGWIPQCEHCNVSLTYHKRTNHLVCHYCGYTISMPRTCLACGGTNLETKGFGTEKVEEELQLIFPNATVERMDLDTTRTRSAYERIIFDFENRNIDILVGTQMVTKGLDFDNVSLVGVLNADNMLSFPDFRAGERSYQLMSQVAGRAGRRGKRGRVLIQTIQPRHEILQYVLHSDYKSMYASQMNDRHEFMYPPFSRLIKITMRHRDEQTLFRAAQVANQSLRNIFANRVLGPEVPLINRVQNRYIINFMLKIEREKSTEKAKLLIKDIFAQLLHIAEFKQVEVVSDVDPM